MLYSKLLYSCKYHKVTKITYRKINRIKIKLQTNLFYFPDVEYSIIEEIKVFTFVNKIFTLSTFKKVLSLSTYQQVRIVLTGDENFRFASFDYVHKNLIFCHILMIKFDNQSEIRRFRIFNIVLPFFFRVLVDYHILRVIFSKHHSISVLGGQQIVMELLFSDSSSKVRDSGKFWAHLDQN